MNQLKNNNKKGCHENYITYNSYISYGCCLRRGTCRRVVCQRIWRLHLYSPNIYNFAYGVFRDEVGYNNGYNAGGRIGYQSNPIRYEVEYTYLRGEARKFNLNFITQLGVTGFTSANTIMANIYYDCPDMLPAIAPFIGLGIGYASLRTELDSIGPFRPSYFTTSDSAFAYQGTVGITYNFSENYAANLAYRYIATDNSSNFGKTYQAHLASVGAIYRFDQGNYK